MKNYLEKKRMKNYLKKKLHPDSTIAQAENETAAPAAPAEPVVEAEEEALGDEAGASETSAPTPSEQDPEKPTRVSNSPQAWISLGEDKLKAEVDAVLEEIPLDAQVKKEELKELEKLFKSVWRKGEGEHAGVELFDLLDDTQTDFQNPEQKKQLLEDIQKAIKLINDDEKFDDESKKQIIGKLGEIFFPTNSSEGEPSEEGPGKENSLSDTTRRKAIVILIAQIEKEYNKPASKTGTNNSNKSSLASIKDYFKRIEEQIVKKRLSLEHEQRMQDGLEAQIKAKEDQAKEAAKKEDEYRKRSTKEEIKNDTEQMYDKQLKELIKQLMK